MLICKDRCKDQRKWNTWPLLTEPVENPTRGSCNKCSYQVFLQFAKVCIWSTASYNHHLIPASSPSHFPSCLVTLKLVLDPLCQHTQQYDIDHRETGCRTTGTSPVEPAPLALDCKETVSCREQEGSMWRILSITTSVKLQVKYVVQHFLYSTM